MSAKRSPKNPPTQTFNIFILSFVTKTLRKANLNAEIMTRWLTLILLCAVGMMLVAVTAVVPKVSTGCTYQHKSLYGTVQFVEKAPDLKVQVVSELPDLQVKFVKSAPQHCGEWQIADEAKLRVQLVESYPDIRVKFVE